MDLDHQQGIDSIVTSLRDISCGIALFLIFKVGQRKIKSRQQRRLDGATFEKKKKPTTIFIREFTHTTTCTHENNRRRMVK
jgi:hypothetical protein